jgi:hypothetical protein
MPSRNNSEEAKVNYEALPLRSDVSDREANQIKSRYRTTFMRFEMLTEKVEAFEDEHRISERWMPNDPQYVQGLKNIAVQRYHLALNKLEHLVVQRLLELTKLNASGLGESQFIEIVRD